MKKKLANAISLGLLALSLSACGAAKENSNQSTAEESSAEEKAQGVTDAGSPIDKLDVCIGPSPETMDPQLNSTLDGNTMIMHCFEGLLKYGEDGKVLPAMAESWETSQDGLN